MVAPFSIQCDMHPYGRPKWTKRAFININKSFININKSFININKSFININKWHDLLILINHL